MIVSARRQGSRPGHFIALRYDTRPQGELVAVVARIVLGQEPGASMHERRLAAEGVVRHAKLFAPLAVEAARDLLGP